MRSMLAAAALILAAGAPQAQVMMPPDELVKDVMVDIQRYILEDKDLRSGDRAKTIRLIEQKALPHFNQLGMTALNLGQIQDAVTALEAYMKIDPNGPMAAEVKASLPALQGMLKK